jgi:hypothetical protein
VDKAGQIIDFLLTAQRDLAAAKRFLRMANKSLFIAVLGITANRWTAYFDRCRPHVTANRLVRRLERLSFHVTLQEQPAHAAA